MRIGSAERLRCQYLHHHAFPNFILGVHVDREVRPSNKTHRADVVALVDPALFRRWERGAEALGVVASRFVELVLREDAAVYATVQRGTVASPHAGVLGCREERVHAFRTYVVNACGGA